MLCVAGADGFDVPLVMRADVGETDLGRCQLSPISNTPKKAF
jgi:hypothetical protein